jgi:hypothetical protein
MGQVEDLGNEYYYYYHCLPAIDQRGPKGGGR